MTFCCVNSGAVTFYGTSTTVLIHEGVTSAYAKTSITNWAQEVNDTDLTSLTYANAEDYENIEGFFYLTVYVELSMEFDDHYVLYGIRDSEDALPSDCEIVAQVEGRHHLNQVDHYGIIGFSSYHHVIVYHDILDPEQDVIVEDWFYDGSPVSISTTS